MSEENNRNTRGAAGRIQRIREELRKHREKSKETDDWTFLGTDGPVDASRVSDMPNKPLKGKETQVPKTSDETKKTKKRSASVDRWGRAGTRFTQVPNLLLESKRRLRIKDSELVVLLYLLKHWWHSSEERLPFPSTKKLAESIGKDVRQIQRILHSLENNEAPVIHGWADEPGYLVRLERRTKDGRQQSNQFDLSKLKNALEAVAIEVEEAAEKVYERKPNPPRVAARKSSVAHNELKQKGYM